MNTCSDQSLLLHGLIDGELDAANSLAIEAHVKACAACADELQRLEAVRASLSADGVSHTMPAAVRNRVNTALQAATAPARDNAPLPQSSHRSWQSPLAGGALVALAASLVLFVATPQLTTAGIQDQLVANHVRSLLANHVTDIATSNRHVVKPWFNGRIDFAPPVPDLAAQGFPLVGGRLDYVDGQVVPAIVYHRRLHTINLFVRPARGVLSPAGFVTRRESFSLVRWAQDGLEFWAVSDIEPDELRQFQRLFAQDSSPSHMP